MAEHSRNHADNNRGGYKKNNDRNSSRNDRGGFGNRRKDNNDSRGNKNYGDRKFGDRDNRRNERDDRGGFGKRRNNNDGKSFGDRKFGDHDDRRGGGKNYGDRKFGNRDDRRNDRNDRGGNRRFDDRNRGPRQDRGNFRSSEDRAKNPSQGYRPAKSSPDIDTDVTGKELENWTLRALRQLEPQNAETVAKHMVMVGRYLDIDPDFALEHAKAAGQRAGRIGVVREVVGIAAYAAEDFELCLRELRTHRRISGASDHLALMVDCERALGRIEKALTLAEEAREEDVPAAVRSEVAIVVSGIHRDAGDLPKAIKALEIPELNPKRGFDYSPRLFGAYADLLEEADRAKEATRWARLAIMTEAALGQGDFADPEIFDIFTEADLLEPEEVSVDLEAAEAEEAELGEQTREAEEAPVEADAEEGTLFDVAEDSEESADEEAEPTAETVVSDEQAEKEARFEITEDTEK